MAITWCQRPSFHSLSFRRAHREGPPEYRRSRLAYRGINSVTGQLVIVTIFLSQQGFISFQLSTDLKPSRDEDILIPSFEVRASRDRDVIGAIQYNALAHPAILEGHLADELAVIIDLAKRCSVCQVAVQRPIGNQVHVNGWSAAVRLDPGR